MLVYRLCSKAEIDYILRRGDCKLIGSHGRCYKNNEHNYEAGYNYMHFFLEKYDVVYHIYNKEYDREKLVCTYDIPDNILNDGSKSVGYYPDFRYSMYGPIIPIDEIAIKSRDISVQFLVKVEMFTPSNDFYSYVICDDIDSLLEVIYEASKEIKRT